MQQSHFNRDFKAEQYVDKAAEGIELEPFLDQEIDRIEELKNGSNALSFFATLIASEVLEVKLESQNSGGTFHDKTGIFTDEMEDSVSFLGSSNETFMGWSRFGNFETLEVFKSWDTTDKRRVKKHQNYLKSLRLNDV